MEREGGCFCGEVRYRLSGEPNRVTYCYCIHCRRLSGAPVVVWAEFPQQSFALTQGDPGSVESRPDVSRLFCRDCGTPLTFRDESGRDIIDVTAASLDDPASVTPDDHVWCDRMPPWLHIDDHLPRHARGRS